MRSGFLNENVGNTAQYINRIVECEAQPDPLTSDGLTKDGKMRFPVFCRFRDASDVDPKVVASGKVWLAALRSGTLSVPEDNV